MFLDDIGIRMTKTNFTSITENSNSRGISISPNPTSNVTVISFNGNDMNGSVLSVIDVTGKTGRRRVVCMPYASQTLMRWKNYLMNNGMTTNKADYVYRHPPFTNIGKAHQPVHNTNPAFQRMLKRIGLDKDAEGRAYSIYSIRHSAITWSLMRNA